MDRPSIAEADHGRGLQERHSTTLHEDDRGQIETDNKCFECKALSKKYGILWAISAIVSIILAACAPVLASIILIPLIIAATLIITFSLKLKCEENGSMNMSFSRGPMFEHESYSTTTTAPSR